MGSPKLDSDVNDSPPLNNQPMGEPGEEGGGGGGGGGGEGGGGGGKEGGGSEEEDPSRPEGVVQFVLTDLNNLDSPLNTLDSQLSAPIMIRNVPWYVCGLAFILCREGGELSGFGEGRGNH